jgi:aspartate aminotransferase
MLYEINEKVITLRNQGKPIINFNVGDPDQITSPEIVHAAFNAMTQGKTKYGSSAGEIKLRERLAELYNVNLGNVIVTPGSKWAIFSILSLLLKDGGNVVVPSPHWSSYELIVKHFGAELRLLKGDLESNWAINLEKLRKMMDNQTRLIILNNPNNPTSKVLDRKNYQDIVELANERKIPILSDETYADISFRKVKSILDYDGDHIFVNSFSKTFTMTGWRIGFAILDQELVQKMVKLNQISISNVPLFIQEAAVKALDLKDDISNEIREVYRRRADLACTLLSKTKLRFTKPDAPFYLFPKCDVDSEEFALDLIDKGVAVVPGTAFGDYNNYFRISLTTPEDAIKIGLKKIAEAFM